MLRGGCVLKVLLISTVVNKSLKDAINSVDCCDVKLMYSYDLRKFSKEELQSFVDWADIVLVDVRGDPSTLSEVDFREKDLVVLVGGSTLMAKSKLGKFRMPAKASATITSPESFKKRIERFQKLIETFGSVLPFGVLKDAKNYVKILKYWGNAGFENYRNLFLFLCKIKGYDVEVEDPVEFPEFGFYHPDFGFDYNPKIDPEKPTVAILFYGGMHFEQCQKTLKALIDRFEGCNVVSVFSDGVVNLRAIELVNADALISLLWFRLNGGPLGGDPKATIELLRKKNMKIFTPALMFNQKLEDWIRDQRGVIGPNYVASVIFPEMDGAVEPIAACAVSNDEVVPIEDRVEKIAERVKKWVELRRKPNSEKRIAVVIYNYPPGEENLGSAAYLDTFRSIEVILEALEKRGYRVEKKEIEKILLERKLFNPELHPLEAMECSRMSVEEYLQFFNSLPEELRKEIVQNFGEPPGDIMVAGSEILIPAVQLGNVVICVQPSRRKKLMLDDVHSAIHDKTKPPHHQYLAFYLWLQKVFGADAIIHLGTHGTAEFMKGKEVGLTSKCYPDILIGSVPSIYVYHVVNVSEATIAKRRLYATLVSYNSPPYTTADLYEDYARLEELIEEFREAQSEARAEIAKRKALELAEKLNLKGGFEEIEAKLYEFKRSIIPKGLHVLGKSYSFEELKEFVLLLSRYDRGEVKSLQRLIAEKRGLKLENARELRIVDDEAKRIVEDFLSGKKVDAEFKRTLEHRFEIAKKFAENSQEIENLLNALEAHYIEPSTGGDVVRNPEALPTGRNLYQFDPMKAPTESASERGKAIAKETLKKFFEKHNKYPESVAVVLWGFETAQTYGETVAQIFEYLGVEIVHKTAWEKEIRVRPLEELKRPRIDVVVTICGFFREMFPNLVELIDKAFEIVSKLEEPENMNYVKKHKAKFRIFGPVATEYGTRMLQLVEDSAWEKESDLAEAYLSSMCYAYGRNAHGLEAREDFEEILKTVELVSQIRSSNDYEITDLDHYYEFFGGLAKAVETLKGKKAEMLIADTTKEFPRVESVSDSIERGTVTRTLNPKWIEEMLKHGFLGVQKIADRVEYLLGLAATTNAVENWIWDRVAERFVLDEKMFERLKKLNVYTTREILERLLEAEKRGYWKAEELKKKVEEKFLEVDGILEEVIG